MLISELIEYLQEKKEELSDVNIKFFGMDTHGYTVECSNAKLYRSNHDNQVYLIGV